MSKRIDFTQLGGLYTFQNTVRYMQEAYREPLGALALFLGDKTVVSGCIDNGVNVTDGFISYNGEIIPFTGGALAATVVISETITKKPYKDGTLKNLYYTKTASLGIGGFPYAELKRLPFNLTSVQSFAEQVITILKGMIQFEPEVILEGCEVTDVDTVPGELAIAAGLVMFNGVLLQSEAYAGAYPAYLKEDGAWVTVEPVAGLFITFDPYTSQRYVNVLDRAMTPAGRIVMMETTNDRFVAEVGRWEMKGYELSAAMQNRVPLGLWWDGVPVANVSNAQHAVEGNQAGEERHTLDVSEMPAHKHNFDDIGDKDTDNVSTYRVVASNSDTAGGSFDAKMELTGGGQSHENRQPFTVVVYAKRVA